MTPTNNPPFYVVDSYAMLAYLEGESGMAVVAKLLADCQQGKCKVMMSVINLGEVLYIVEREQGLASAQITLAAIEQLPIEMLPAQREVVLAAAHIKANHRLSYADAFAAAAALEHQAILVTGDEEFESVHDLVQIQWLPK
jgi:predicted nucleic acid-binding protein